MAENHYYPFGMTLGGQSWQSPTSLENRYLYNGKELQDNLGLDWYDYGARFYDAQLARWHSIDPKGEKYYSLSPYNYVLNNPMNLIDPDGKDCIFTIQRNDKNEIIGVTISSTVYITGARASEDRATALNKQAKDVFKSSTTDDKVKINFDITYKYVKSIDQENLKAGENVLNFVDFPGEKGVAGSVPAYTVGGVLGIDNKGTIFSNEDEKTVMHETGHLLGLHERTDPIGNADIGFSHNLMSYEEGTKLHAIQYRRYYEFAMLYKYVKTPNPIVNKLIIDWNNTDQRRINQLDYPQYFK